MATWWARVRGKEWISIAAKQVLLWQCNLSIRVSCVFADWMLNWLCFCHFCNPIKSTWKRNTDIVKQGQVKTSFTHFLLLLEFRTYNELWEMIDGFFVLYIRISPCSGSNWAVSFTKDCSLCSFPLLLAWVRTEQKIVNKYLCSCADHLFIVQGLDSTQGELTI